MHRRYRGVLFAFGSAALFGSFVCACVSLSEVDAAKLRHAQTTLLLAYTDSADAHAGDVDAAYSAAKAMERGAFCGINGVLVGNGKEAVDAGPAIICTIAPTGGDQ